jgi:hypothetical protein
MCKIFLKKSTGQESVFLNNLKQLTQEGLKKLSAEDTKKYSELTSKESLSEDEKKSLKNLRLRSKGFFRNRSEFNSKLDTLSPKLFYSSDTIALSYYLKDNNIYPYLTHKYEKYLKLGGSKSEINSELIGERLTHLPDSKLNAEIRAVHNDIDWSYGKCVILRGQPSAIIGDRRSNEVVLLRPWENGGDYFKLELAEPNTLLIGPKSDLEPHIEELKRKRIKFAYLESLTFEQAEKLDCPQRFRSAVSP